VTRVFIVAASPLVRTSLESLLSGRGFSIAGSSGDLELISEQLMDAAADVALVDASDERWQAVMETIDWSGVASGVNVVVLIGGGGGPNAWAAEALRAGVRAVLPEDVLPDQLVAALEAAALGLTVMHPAQTEALLAAPVGAARRMAELAEPLTPREREVLQMLASGWGNKEIASRLSISEHTVKFHVTAILGKLGASSRTEAVFLGIRRGLVLL
jgi:two-component system, NarL family, response regulator YdfI